jgi:tight adherence protein B
MYLGLSREFEELRNDIRCGLISPSKVNAKYRELMFMGGANISGYLSVRLSYTAAVGVGVSSLLTLLSTHFAFAWTVQRKINQGKAASEITGHLLRWLPWMALLASQILGLPTVSFLIFQPVGWVVTALAVALTFAAHVVAKRFVARMSEVEPDPGLWLSLVAAAIREGAGINRAVGALREVVGGPLAEVEIEVVRAIAQGGSVASRLESVAVQKREQALAAKEQQVERLPVKLLLPLGLFLIPQFVLLLVVPVIATTLQGAHLI